MGVGLDPVESQRQAAGLFLLSLAVIQGQEVPTGLRCGRVDLQRLEPGRLGLIESQRGDSGHRLGRDGTRRPSTDSGANPIEVIQRLLPGWRRTTFGRRPKVGPAA